MAAPLLTAPPAHAELSTGPAPTNGIIIHIVPSRFKWERALRMAPIPRHLKGFLLYLGTWMSGDGRDCRPPSRQICDEWGLSRQRVFELFHEAESSGWLRTEKRVGKPSERVPCIPDPSGGSDGSTPESAGDPSDRPDGSGQTKRPAIPPTRQTGLTPPSDRSDPPRQTGLTQQDQDRIRTGSIPGARPPDPPRPERPQAVTRNDQHDPLTAVPDHNDTKQVTSQTRTRGNTVSSHQMPMLSLIDGGIADQPIPVDDYQLTLPVPIPPPPLPDADREAEWAGMQPAITKLTQRPTSARTSA